MTYEMHRRAIEVAVGDTGVLDLQGCDRTSSIKKPSLNNERVSMTTRTLIACVTAIALAWGTGCTTVIKYDLTDLPVAHPDSKRQAMRVAVAPLLDMRPEQEKNPPHLMFTMETQDSKFKDNDVAHGMSEALVTHFNHVQLFKTAEMVDKSAALPSSGVLEKMKGLGFDALFTGTVTHFYGVGYATAFDRAAVLLALIPVTVVVTLPIMLMEDNQNEGFVEVVDVQLTDTKSGGVLWSGTFSKKRTMNYADAEPARAASETLREVADEIVKQIEATDIKLAVQQ